MEITKGQDINIRKLIREDVDKMQMWEKHEDPLFNHYNFPTMNQRESDLWYQVKTMKFKRKSFAIENKEEIIGYLSIRNIKWVKKESELGIVLNPKYINQGYGKKAIKVFLDYYFNELKMKSIILRTAQFNKRAIKCYLHCGFRVIGVEDEEFEDQDSPIFYNPTYRDLRKWFIIVRGKKTTKYIHMKITLDEYREIMNRLSTKKS